jgi:sugar lactone lactonase YvrE
MSVPAIPTPPPRLSLRRPAVLMLGVLLLVGTAAGALVLVQRDTASTEPERIWGHRGRQNGDMIRPRAAAIDREDRLFIVDFTARFQVYDRDGNYLGRTWYPPDFRSGRPSGLSIARDGNLLVSDSHNNCFRIYDADGKELRAFTYEPGPNPGQLGYVSDVEQDEDGFFYVAEFGENHRISKFDADGKFVTCWGQQGMEPGEFGRIRALALGPDGNLYVADASNHRIQVFSRDGKLVRIWGEAGNAPGQLSYPYDLAFGKTGELYVVEYGNNRVQKFTAVGESLGCWGGSGKGPGQLLAPWALAIDSKGRLHVLDTENHRVQRIAF